MDHSQRIAAGDEHDVGNRRRARGVVERARERANEIDLDVVAQGRALLLIAVTRHKYWAETIDGREAPLRAANIALQSLIIERGRHHVRLAYRNPLVIGFAWT